MRREINNVQKYLIKAYICVQTHIYIALKYQIYLYELKKQSDREQLPKVSNNTYFTLNRQITYNLDEPYYIYMYIHIIIIVTWISWISLTNIHHLSIHDSQFGIYNKNTTQIGCLVTTQEYWLTKLDLSLYILAIFK